MAGSDASSARPDHQKATSPDTPKTRRSWRQRSVLLLGVASTLGLIAMAGAIGYERWRLDQLETVDVSLVEPATGEAENYLIVGSDSREVVDADGANADVFFDGTEPGGQRSDTLIIARIDPDEEQAQMLSIPRDLWVPMDIDEGFQRINAAYAVSRQFLIDTIQDNFDIPIHHYIEVDFNGFTRLVDVIDGIPMYFDTAMRDLNSGLWINGEGCVNLDGEQALALARSRHLEYEQDGEWVSDDTGDLGRITRQQILILKAVEQGVRIDLTDPVRFDRVVSVGLENVGVDDGIGFDEVAGLIQRFQEVNDDTLATYSLPVENFQTAGGAWVLDLLEAQAEPTLELFRGGEITGPHPAFVELDVVNGTGIEGQATAASQALAAIGFVATPAAEPARREIDGTEVRFPPGRLQAADLLARHLTGGAELIEDPTLQGRLRLITGPDFSTVMEIPRPPDPDGPQARPAEDADEVTTTTTPDPDATTTTVAADEGDSDEAETTATTVVGKTPGEAPEGVECRS